jgi:hypothetical protein
MTPITSASFATYWQPDSESFQTCCPDSPSSHGLLPAELGEVCEAVLQPYHSPTPVTRKVLQVYLDDAVLPPARQAEGAPLVDASSFLQQQEGPST